MVWQDGAKTKGILYITVGRWDSVRKCGEVWVRAYLPRLQRRLGGWVLWVSVDLRGSRQAGEGRVVLVIRGWRGPGMAVG